ncbi:lipid A deacylase LpxR family protein [Sulfurimonas sp. SAG-AH-194-I05]|nr:lipid A deacylase LpxR family protein [Sulfurimonas sp. SAG-AH-194-I05]MDF1875297.1 lipid A deacylase LpxR family protein [Sulfurimonas sp. SAG-AH-194-I05]
MKYLLTLLITLMVSVQLQAANKEWIFERLNIYAENDVFYATDKSYSAGQSFDLLYEIPNEDYALYSLLGNNDVATNSYITFALANQIFTPTDVATTSLILDDRPYAGWTYFETGIHKASKDELRSLTLKIGTVGPASQSESIQRTYHKIMNFDKINGWDNQINNELGINLKYTQKWRYKSKTTSDLESAVIPFVSAEVGNIAINATAGIKARLGWNIEEDFGVSSMNIGADPGILAYGQKEYSKKRPWGFSFNLMGAGSAVAHDIFLDGNNFSDSHSVEKENFVAYYGFGFSVRYQKFLLDFSQIHNSKQFKLEKESHTITSLVASYRY